METTFKLFIDNWSGNDNSASHLDDVLRPRSVLFSNLKRKTKWEKKTLTKEEEEGRKPNFHILSGQHLIV